MIGERVGASDPTNYAYLQAVEAAIAAHGLDERVVWTGYQPETEVSADLAASDLLLMPYEDGASLRRGALMAGLAHGCAIVTTTPQAPLPELVDGRDLLYAPPGDPDAAAAAVLRIAQDPALADRLRANARAVANLFSWERIAEAHERLYLD
jgi:glycosyltransferase involved in cell wall biosynthesis